MIALVTGAEGNIGKPLCAALEEAGWDVWRVDTKPGYRDGYLTADVRNPIDLMRVTRHGVDVIFHLASMVSRVTCEDAPSTAVDVNVVGTQNMIELAQQTGARLVYFSTSEVYGPEQTLMREAGDAKPNNLYGLSKLLGEQLVEYAMREWDLDAMILRPFMMYDEAEDMGAHRSAMIRFAENLCARNPVVVHRGAARGWLHSSDAVRAIISAATVDAPHDERTVNIGHPDVRPVKELARMIASQFGTDYGLIIEADLPGRMTAVKNPHLDRQRRLLGFEPVVTLEDGVARVCARMRDRTVGPVH